MLVEELHRFTGDEHHRLVEAGGFDVRWGLRGDALPLDVVGAGSEDLRAVLEHAAR